MVIEAPSAPLFVDNSLLSTVDCSTDVALRHIHGYTSLEEKAPMKAGTATHHALAVWFEHKDRTATLETFEEHYRDFADEFVEDPEDRLTYYNTSSILEHWLDTKGIELVKDVELIPGFVEVAFAYPLGAGAGSDVSASEGAKKKRPKEAYELDPKVIAEHYLGSGHEFVFCGRFDMLVRWKGQIYVWENKTTGSVSNLKNTLRFGSQLAGYLWAAKKIMAEQSPLQAVNVSGVICNAIEYRKVAKSMNRCSQHGVKYAECGMLHLGHAFLGPMGRSPEMLAEWEKTALHLAKRYRELMTKYPAIESVAKLRTQGQFEYGRCPNCSFGDFCLAGRPLDKVDTMLRREEWSPFEGVIQESQVAFMAGEVARRAATR